MAKKVYDFCKMIATKDSESWSDTSNWKHIYYVDDDFVKAHSYKEYCLTFQELWELADNNKINAEMGKSLFGRKLTFYCGFDKFVIREKFYRNSLSVKNYFKPLNNYTIDFLKENLKAEQFLDFLKDCEAEELRKMYLD